MSINIAGERAASSVPQCPCTSTLVSSTGSRRRFIPPNRPQATETDLDTNTSQAPRECSTRTQTHRSKLEASIERRSVIMTLDTPAAVVLELMTMGQQSAAHLGDLFRATAAPTSPHQELAAEILRCCGRVIDALRATAASSTTTTSGHKRKAAAAAAEYQDAAAAGGASSSPPPPPGPPPKRRARGAEATKEVTHSTTMVDGFVWRKYGQKDINGYKHPRLYYRCANKDQGCTATRRVQRTQDQPAAYEIAYYGEHTCGGAATAWHQGAAAAAAAPPAVVDFGSNSADTTTNRGSPSPPASMSQGGGWSSPSASSEVGYGFEAQAALHEWHDTAAPDPVMEFLDGCFGWESVVLQDRCFDFAGRPL